ncbi:MAG: Sua5/YciO/YrdC/YwlC family protein [Treponema sp.]|nr:Sua5/YciO/YrdC/YwlC family protein [Treponema sp.]
MIEYIVPGNIDDRILAKTAKILREGGTAAIPTDTSWSIVCAIDSREGIKRLRAISKERDERLFTLLCADISQFGELCCLDNSRFRLIKRLSPGPYVFILKTLLGTEKVLGLRRREIGIRLPDYPVPQALINALGCPLYGITAKRNMAADWIDDDYSGGDDAEENNPEEGEPSAPVLFYREEALFDGGWEMEDIRGLDLILDPGEDQRRGLSTVLDLRSADVQVLREGIGAWPA